MKVADIGSTDAKIMIVSEAPGRTEEQTGRPFSGASGQLLRQMLQHVGIDYNQCYVTNVVDIRPPDNGFSSFYEQKNRKEPTALLLNYHDALRAKILKIRPNIVIALGAEALRAITNKRGIEAWRGSVMKYDEVKILATYHPSTVLRSYNMHPIVEMDLTKALAESTSKGYYYQEPSTVIRPSLVQTLKWLKNCKNYPRVSWDIETIGQHVRCIGLAVGASINPSSIVIPFIKFPSSNMVMPGEKNLIRIGEGSGDMTSYWNKHDELLVLNALADVLENKSIQKVGHNSISFDASIMKKEFNIDIANHYMDTMHAFHLIYSELPMGLKFLSTIMMNIPNYWKEKQTSSDNSEWKYCGMDAICTLVISYKLDDEINSKGMRRLYRHINNLAISLTTIQNRGITVDTVARDAMIVEQKKKLVDITVNIESVAGKGFNPNSPKQVKELLHDKMKFPTTYKKGNITTDEATIKKLIRRYPQEIILKNIVSYRKVTKLINTFLEINLDDDGKMRTNYNASGTKSGRISSSKTLWDSGMNLQNIPVGKSKGVENIRNIFVPSKCAMFRGVSICQGYGCKVCGGSGKKLFIKADLEQAEALVVAEILFRHGDPTLRNLHKDRDFDVHIWMIDQIYKYTKVASLKGRRDIGKLVNHSGNYRAGPGVLVNKAIKEEIEGIDFQLAKLVLAARLKAIPGLKKWWRWVEKKVASTRTLETCFGRKRIFFGRLDETTFRDAYSFEPQSIVGDVTNRILTKIEMNVDSKIDLLLQVHDEVDGECYEKDLDEVVTEINLASLIPIFINDTPLIIPIDVEVGSNWRDVVSYKEYKNRNK